MPHKLSLDRKIGRRAWSGWPYARAALGAVLTAMAVCAGSGAARAGDDISSFYDNFLQALGVRSSDDSINYSERSPLVVPPTRDLPPPAVNARPAVPDWPKDPDLSRAAAQAKTKDTVGPHPDWATSLSMPLRPDELTVPGANTHRSTSAPSSTPSAADYPEYNPSNKGNIFGFGWFKKKQYATFTGEPPRQTLTDPPPGYLTPSPDQPYGVGPANSHYEVPTVASRMELQR